MTMKPYIFLSENYLHNLQDENAEEIELTALEDVALPYSQVLYFTDEYNNIVNRTIDTIALQGTNIKNMTVEAYVNGAYTTFITISGNTSTDLIVKAASAVTTSSIRINIPDDGTNPASVNGKIGIYGFICNLCGLTDSSYKIEANEGSYRVVSGRYIHYADYKKWVGKISIENLEKEQLDALTAQADKGEMTVVPYEDLDAEEIYECAVKREYSYEIDRKTQLFKLDLELNEL